MSGSQDGEKSAVTSGPRDRNASARAAPSDGRDLDQRLAAAYAQREKILKAKGKPLTRRPVRPPSFLEKGAEGGPDLRLDVDHRGTEDRENEGSAPELAESPTQAAHSSAQKASTRRLAVPTVALIGCACFFGLGAGVVFGFAAASGMGWISISGSVPEPLEPKQQVVERAPALQSKMSSTLGYLVPADARPSLSVANDQIVETRNAALHYLLTPPPPDTAISAVKSPGPKLETVLTTEKLLPLSDFQPLHFETILANPVFLSAHPGTLSSKDDVRDGLPNLPEKSNIEAMLKVNLPNPPPPNDIKLASLTQNDNSVDLLSQPVLLEIEPGAVPQLLNENPGKLSVFDAVMDGLAMPTPIPASHALEIPMLSRPPHKSKIVAVPEVMDTAFALPKIGNPRQGTITLAEQLAQEGAPSDAVYLVTFAPNSLGEAQMASHTALLQSTGFEAEVVNRVRYRISSTHVRYYNRSDSIVANAIAERLGGDARDFTNIRKPPEQGRIEIYLEGERRKQSATGTLTRRATAPVNRASEKARLEQSILSRLRRGEHYRTDSQ